MGGSAIGGDLAHAALDDRLTKPLETVRGYAPSPVTPPDRLILCSSYTGDTEETVACYEAAAALGAPRIVVSTGGSLTEMARRDGVPVIGLPAGLQPRVAVGYMFVAAAEVIRVAGARRDGHGSFSAVFLTDRDQHPRVRRRFELTAELIEPHAAEVITVETEGETRTERLLWAVALGDLVSLGLAGLRGVDPGPVEVIEKLKDRLGRP